MKISARNALKGRIVEVTKGATTAHVKIDSGGNVVTSSITNASVEDLDMATTNPARDARTLSRHQNVAPIQRLRRRLSRPMRTYGE
jgi:molybdopterin-binding protein